MKPEPMQRVKLGSTNLAVAPIGLGTGGFGTRSRSLRSIGWSSAMRRWAGISTTRPRLRCLAARRDRRERARTRRGAAAHRPATRRGDRHQRRHPAFGECYPRPDRYLEPRCWLASGRQPGAARRGALDLWILHRDDSRVPVDEILEAVGPAVTRGRVGLLGARNWTVPRLAEAADYAERTAGPASRSRNAVEPGHAELAGRARSGDADRQLAGRGLVRRTALADPGVLQHRDRLLRRSTRQRQDLRAWRQPRASGTCGAVGR